MTVRRAALLALAALAGAVVGAAIVTIVRRTGGDGAEDGAAVHVALALGAVLIGFAVHEAGHVAGGLSQGFAFVFWAVGPLWIGREQGRVRFRLNRSPATWGGMAACLPHDTRDLTRRFSIAIAGGPAASLLWAGIAGTGWALLPSGGASRFAAATAAAVSLALFAVTVQPFGAGGGFASDGGRFWRLRRGGEAAEREAALLALTALSLAGERPREWPEPAIAVAERLDDGSPYGVAAAVLVFQHALDRGEHERAARSLERALRWWDGLHELARGDLAAEAAFFLARAGDLERARFFLDRARGPLLEAHRLHRARAAVALAEGRHRDATEHSALGLKALAQPMLTASPLDRELLEAIAEQARANPA